MNQPKARHVWPEPVPQPLYDEELWSMFVIGAGFGALFLFWLTLLFEWTLP